MTRHTVSFTDEKWGILKNKADAFEMSVGEMVDYMINCYFQAFTQEAWPEYVPPGRPIKADNGMCHCGTEARIVENGITCEVCGKPMF